MGDKLGFGIQLKVGDGASPETFAKIASLQDLEEPDVVLETVEVTDHDSAGNAREYIAGLIEGGEVAATFNYDPSDTQQTQLKNDRAAGTKRNYQILVPSSPNVTVAFAAFVTRFKPISPLEEANTVEVTLKVTGLPTWT